MQLLLVMKTEKLKLGENRIRKMVSFESVNVDSDFFLSNARDKTKNIFLCFLKEVDRIMQNSSECLFYSFLWKTRGNHQSVTYLSPNWMGSTNFKQRYCLTDRRVC